jgi:cytochrome P450
MTLLLAGHETTAMALVWALAAIDQAPAVRDALEAEWDAGGKGNNDVPAGTSSSGQPPGTLPSATLPLTTAVLAETLRLWPPSWMFSRRLTEPLTLGGRTLSAGTMCLISPALLHRDARWWAEPDEFRPHRWLRREPDQPDRFDPKAPGQPRGAFLPFGAGPRMCIGEQFAWAEAAIVLAELGRTWRIHISPTPLSPGPSSMTLRPKDPVKATTSRRDMASWKHA